MTVQCFRMLSVKPAAQRTHVVEYLGHFSEISPEDYKLVLVFELCDSNLDALIKVIRIFGYFTYCENSIEVKIIVRI